MKPSNHLRLLEEKDNENLLYGVHEKGAIKVRRERTREFPGVTCLDHNYRRDGGGRRLMYQPPRTPAFKDTLSSHSSGGRRRREQWRRRILKRFAFSLRPFPKFILVISFARNDASPHNRNLVNLSFEPLKK